MKKVLLSGFVITSFVIYSLVQKRNPTTSVTTTQNSIDTLPKTNGSMMNQGNGMMSQGAYRDGSYTGSAADAFYGNIQVRATIQNGKITEVAFLQYPNDRHESIQINRMAMPQLQSEAIQAQTAQVDIVSGATDTSQAFVQSLESALNQAI